MFHVHHIDYEALVQKCRELNGRVWFTPLYITTIVADLIKYNADPIPQYPLTCI